MNERDLFIAALQKDDAGQRREYLRDACGPDAALLERVEGLLQVYEGANSFLESPASAPTLTVEPPRLMEGPGTVIGPYRLMEQIGEGGMGVVYVAEQTHPVRRKVAMKIIKPGMDTKQVVARFEAERQALALMDHPNISRVIDAGATDSGLPYFVMELVRGIPITEYCDREKLPIAERLELFVSACRAVQHAHQKGVIHRDLKPSNILVTVIDGAAVPKVIDFGVAKATGQSLTERSLYTGFHQLVGTPLYMSPEQADLSGMDVDTRSDVYSLGVLLYELLTGTTPFDRETFRQAAFDELRRIIREEEPPRPSTRLSSLGVSRATVSANRQADARHLDRAVRGELDWIVMKALEKDRRRRYETANDFASDVMRYLGDQPVEACPPSAGYRLRKFASRNRKGLATAALLTASGVIVACVLGVAYVQGVSRVRQVMQDVRQALAGARTAIAARDLTLASQRVSEARGRLGADAASLPDLAAEIGGIRREIDARQADASRFDRFHKGASDAQDKMSHSRDLGGERVAEETLGLYGVLTKEDWSSRLESSYLTSDQKQQVRETAYVTLVSLADNKVRWLRSRDDLESVQRSLDLLRLAETFHESTRAFYFVRAECRRRRGDEAPADEDVKLFKAAAARTAWDYFLPGHTAGWNGDLDEAIRSYRAALALQPNHYNSLFFLAMRFGTDKINRRPEAVQLFTACIALRPDDFIAYRNRAVCYNDLGQLGDAIADTRQALRLQPGDFASHYNLGVMLKKHGKPDEAIACYREAIRLQPGLGCAHNNLGGLMERQGKLDEAMACYREAVRVQPRHADHNSNLARLLANWPDAALRDVPKAVALARKAIELGPREKGCWGTLGVAHYRAGDWRASLAALEKSMELGGGDAFEWLFLAMAHWRLGHNAEARAWYDKAVAWMAQNRRRDGDGDEDGPRDVDLLRFRAEAEALLGAADLPADVFARP